MKSIQQILKEQQQLSRLSEINEANINRSLALQGVPKDPDSVKKSAETRRTQARHLDEQQRAYQRELKLGKPNLANKKPKSSEHKKKISQTLTGSQSYKRTEESKTNHLKSIKKANGKSVRDPNNQVFETLTDAGIHYGLIWNTGSVTASRKIRALTKIIESGWQYV
jgi:chromosome segregation ATPase